MVATGRAASGLGVFKAWRVARGSAITLIPEYHNALLREIFRSTCTMGPRFQAGA